MAGYIVNKKYEPEFFQEYDPRNDLPSSGGSRIGDIYQLDDGTVWRFDVFETAFGGELVWYRLYFYSPRYWLLKIRGLI